MQGLTNLSAGRMPRLGGHYVGRRGHLLLCRQMEGAVAGERVGPLVSQRNHRLRYLRLAVGFWKPRFRFRRTTCRQGPRPGSALLRSFERSLARADRGSVYL